MGDHIASRPRYRRRHSWGVSVAMLAQLDAPEFFGSEVTRDLEGFKSRCDLIVANRWSDDLADVAEKVYTRDLFRRD